ncbi:MAG: hypothetical protein II180_12240 [Proteobacteria bacterium]|nr:hypothetical protein [Pseudomonadota bacterium]
MERLCIWHGYALHTPRMWHGYALHTPHKTVAIPPWFCTKPGKLFTFPWYFRTQPGKLFTFPWYFRTKPRVTLRLPSAKFKRPYGALAVASLRDALDVVARYISAQKTKSKKIRSKRQPGWLS